MATILDGLTKSIRKEEKEVSEISWGRLYQELSQPFPSSEISWRAGATTRDKKKAQALPYAEPRVYEDRLNEVCPGDWSVRFMPWGENRIICELTVFNCTRSSTGEENDGFAPGTAAEAQAFKRACVKFGLGRYMYDIPIQWVDYDSERSRLIDVPQLPEKFLPNKSNTNKSNTVDKPVLLPEDRAKKMEDELIKMGYDKQRYLKMVANVVGKSVSSLSQLTESEALSVWTYAKRNPLKDE